MRVTNGHQEYYDDAAEELRIACKALTSAGFDRNELGPLAIGLMQIRRLTNIANILTVLKEKL